MTIEFKARVEKDGVLLYEAGVPAVLDEDFAVLLEIFHRRLNVVGGDQETWAAFAQFLMNSVKDIMVQDIAPRKMEAYAAQLAVQTPDLTVVDLTPAPPPPEPAPAG